MESLSCFGASTLFLSVAFSFSFCNSLSTIGAYLYFGVCVIASLVQTLNCSDCHYQCGRIQMCMCVYVCTSAGPPAPFGNAVAGESWFVDIYISMYIPLYVAAMVCVSLQRLSVFVVTVAIAIGAFAVVFIVAEHYHCSGAAKVLLWLGWAQQGVQISSSPAARHSFCFCLYFAFALFATYLYVCVRLCVGRCCDYFVVVFTLVADVFIFHFLIRTTLCATHV